jgi:hypothetical protein
MFPIKQNFCNNENFCKTEILQIFVKFGDISHFRENFKKTFKKYFNYNYKDKAPAAYCEKRKEAVD